VNSVVFGCWWLGMKKCGNRQNKLKAESKRSSKLKAEKPEAGSRKGGEGER